MSRLVGMMGSKHPPKLLPATLGLSLLLGSMVGWPVAAGVSRLRRQERVVRMPFERRARWGAIGFTLLTLAFAASMGRRRGLFVPGFDGQTDPAISPLQ